MAGPRVDDDERPLLRMDDDAGRRRDRDQAIIDRARQRAAVEDQGGSEIQHVWRLFGHVRVILIAPLAPDVEAQHAALPGIHGVVDDSRPRI